MHIVVIVPFYGGADDENPPTCFTVNAPLSTTCEATDNICNETVDIQNHLCILLKAVCSLHENGLDGRTLLVGTIMKATSKYKIDNELIGKLTDKQDTCWGSGL